MYTLAMMAFKGSIVFVINLLIGIGISGVFGFEVLRPIRKPIPYGIPIRPLDKSTIQRLARRPTELNPDSEPIFLPYQRANRRPLQIMERISVPTDPHASRNRGKKDHFNVLNFEAYVMKPNDGGPPRPVSERIYRLLNQSDYRGDPKSNPNNFHKYRTRSASKRPKKNAPVSHVKEFDDLEFYKAFLEHQKHAAMTKLAKLKPKPESRLPIGIDFFEHKQKNKMAFPPITYQTPLYLNNLHRSQQFDDVHRSQSYEDVHRSQQFDDVHRSQPFFTEDLQRSPTFESVYQQSPVDDVYAAKKFNDRAQPHENVEASNVQRVHLRRAEMSHQEETSTPTTVIPVVPTTIVLPMDYEETQAQSQALTQTIVPPEMHASNEPDTMYDFGSRPEMYKFTIDDVVVKPQAQRLVKHPFTGPVTLSPGMHSSLPSLPSMPPTMPSSPKNVPMNHRPHADYLIPVSANTIHEHRYNGRHHVHMNYPLKNFIRGNYRPYKSHMPIQAAASSNQQIHKYSPEPMTLTTPIALPTEKLTNAASVKATYEIDSKRQDRRNRRRKPITDRQKLTDTRKANQQKEFLNNLEFSSSYSKRRTQGYNSDEEVATTPISPIKPKTTNETNRQEIYTVSTTTPKNEKVKYFQ